MSLFKFSVELSAIAMNTLTLLGFVNSKYLLEKIYGNPLMNYYSILMGISFVIYILSMSILSFFAFVSNNFLFAVGGIFVIILPFLIGCASTYAKLNFYINLQTITLFLSLLFLIRMVSTI